MNPLPDSVLATRARRRRAVRVVSLLCSGTFLGLILSWSYPEATVWHFWGVTQVLPIFYLVLSIWAAWPLPKEEQS